MCGDHLCRLTNSLTFGYYRYRTHPLFDAGTVEEISTVNLEERNPPLSDKTPNDTFRNAEKSSGFCHRQHRVILQIGGFRIVAHTGPHFLYRILHCPVRPKPPWGTRPQDGRAPKRLIHALIRIHQISNCPRLKNAMLSRKVSRLSSSCQSV